MDYLLSIDQGTTGTRTYVFDLKGRVLGSAYREHAQYFPQLGWVEHDAAEIWQAVQATGRAALKAAGLRPGGLAGKAVIGITNQRETCVLWDRRSSRPLHRAIVWQCRRTAAHCERLKQAGSERPIRAKTGLLLDAYFSATKAAWLLDHTPGARQLAAKGQAALGTIDSWLLWQLSGGAVHSTDPTNASRTLLYNIRTQAWDAGLLRSFRVPASLLGRVLPSAGLFGRTRRGAFCGADVAITGMAGDQQAALFGQGCFKPGSMKNTYGTGCFLLLNLGKKFRLSKHRLLTTLACDEEGKPAYALEGAVFIGGAAMQWVRDGLGLVKSAGESAKVAASLKDNGGVYLVPAFVGLGAPHWDMAARGLLTGITRGTGRAQVVRAALESMAFQSGELIKAMQADAGLKIRRLRVDGGASRNDWLLRFQADLSNLVVERPAVVETTALGAAMLAGVGAGWLKGAKALKAFSRAGATFKPSMQSKARRALWAGWDQAIRQARTL